MLEAWSNTISSQKKGCNREPVWDARGLAKDLLWVVWWGEAQGGIVPLMLSHPITITHRDPIGARNFYKITNTNREIFVETFTRCDAYCDYLHAFNQSFISGHISKQNIYTVPGENRCLYMHIYVYIYYIYIHIYIHCVLCFNKLLWNKNNYSCIELASCWVETSKFTRLYPPFSSLSSGLWIGL